MLYRTVSSPLGGLILASDGRALAGLWLPGQKNGPAEKALSGEETEHLLVFQQTECWLAAYFSGGALPPLPPLAPSGTAFQQKVWKLLLDIPYGQTQTYGRIATQLRERGISASARAVGGAVSRNPISILIPCHRVIGAGGCLTGYAGGLAAKKFLLKLEGMTGKV